MRHTPDPTGLPATSAAPGSGAEDGTKPPGRPSRPRRREAVQLPSATTPYE